MSFNMNQATKDLLNGIQKGAQITVNLYCPESEPLEEVASELEMRFQPEAIVMDLSQYTTFSDLVRDLILQLLLRDDKPENCHVADAAIEELNLRLLRRHTGRLLSAFQEKKAWICLILKNFEAVGDRWDDSDCAWLRELADTGLIPGCVILSNAPISQICEKPEGSSPLYNIFRVYPLKEDC